MSSYATPIHSFGPRSRSAAARAALAGAILLGLGACVPSTMNWSPAESPKALRVDTLRFSHDVAFAGSATGMNAASQAALTAFLWQNSVTGEDEVLIGAPLDGPDASLAKRRAAAVERVLGSAGLAATVVALPEGPVSVHIVRHVVTPPACPDWSKPALRDHGNSVHSNFGCATATNLGAMVARPQDLVEGREPGPHDSTVLVRGIRKYQDGPPSGAQALPPIVISTGGGQ